MPVDLVDRIKGLLNRKPWYELPRLFAIVRLIEMRNDLREKNLHDTEEPAMEVGVKPSTDPVLLEGRTIDGTHNDLGCPQDGIGGPAVRPQLPARACVARYAEPAGAESPRGEPRADDARRVPASRDPQSAGGVVDSVHGPRLVRAWAVENGRD